MKFKTMTKQDFEEYQEQKDLENQWKINKAFFLITPENNFTHDFNYGCFRNTTTCGECRKTNFNEDYMATIAIAYNNLFLSVEDISNDFNTYFRKYNDVSNYTITGPENQKNCCSLYKIQFCLDCAVEVFSSRNMWKWDKTVKQQIKDKYGSYMISCPEYWTHDVNQVQIKNIIDYLHEKRYKYELLTKIRGSFWELEEYSTKVQKTKNNLLNKIDILNNDHAVLLVSSAINSNDKIFDTIKTNDVDDIQNSYKTIKEKIESCLNEAQKEFHQIQNQFYKDFMDACSQTETKKIKITKGK